VHRDNSSFCDRLGQRLMACRCLLEQPISMDRHLLCTNSKAIRANEQRSGTDRTQQQIGHMQTAHMPATRKLKLNCGAFRGRVATQLLGRLNQDGEEFGEASKGFMTVSISRLRLSFFADLCLARPIRAYHFCQLGVRCPIND
jgi:hypothetical protein